MHLGLLMQWCMTLLTVGALLTTLLVVTLVIGELSIMCGALLYVLAADSLMVLSTR